MLMMLMIIIIINQIKVKLIEGFASSESIYSR